MGQILWVPEDEPAQTPSALDMSVRSPETPNLTEDSRVLIASRGPVEGGPIPELEPETLILEEGSDSTYLTLKAKDVNEHNTLILLMEHEGGETWIAREYLPGVLVDLQHIRVQIPSGYLAKPGILQLEATRVGNEVGRPVGSEVGGGASFATIYVMSKDRPSFSAIDPDEVSADDLKDGVTVRILGSGFTAESEVLTSFQVHVGHERDALKPFSITPHEMQVKIPSSLFEGTSLPGNQALLWVRNGDDQHVSDPQGLRLLSSLESPVAGAKVPLIASTFPYPVPLMDSQSPAFTLLKIYGENFTKGDSVFAKNDDSNRNEKLKTEFISSQELQAWLPRGLWRHHRVSFRLIGLTSKGTCAVESWENEW